MEIGFKIEIDILKSEAISGLYTCIWLESESNATTELESEAKLLEKMIESHPRLNTSMG